MNQIEQLEEIKSVIGLTLNSETNILNEKNEFLDLIFRILSIYI